MTIAYSSIASKVNEDTNGDGGAGSNTITIDKPSGVVDDDLMIAFIGAEGTTNAFSLSGWTSITTASVGANELNTTALFRVASSEGANYTFIQTSSGENDAQGGAILRFTGDSFGAGASNIVSQGGTESSEVTSHTWDTGLTVDTTTSILVMGMFGIGNQATWSTQAITNDDPTWTERLDSVIDAAVVDGGICVATAPVSAASATGGWSATSSATVKSGSILLSIDEDAFRPSGAFI